MLLSFMLVLLSCPGCWTSDDQAPMGGSVGGNGWAARFVSVLRRDLIFYNRDYRHLFIVKGFPCF
jgi:hypothetical protein